ncbi:MAG: trehalose-6-phosphate synthase [Anaerolineales bacterium]
MSLNLNGGISDQDFSYFIDQLISKRRLIIASNRGPVTIQRSESGELTFQRGSGGLVTALTGVARYAETRWIACAQSEEDKLWSEGLVSLGEDADNVWIQFLTPDETAYDGYYKVIANPLLWFLQHSMWNIYREPIIDASVWRAWENGYTTVNKLFAKTIAEQIQDSSRPSLVMLQDYHLYMAASFIRYGFRPSAKYTLTHFIHIPWPGSEDWGLLPAKMRLGILEGLCAVDLLGFQTREDSLNFIRTCESHLPGAHVNFKDGRVWYRDHATHVRDFPISIDVNGLRQLAKSDDVETQRNQLLEYYGSQKIILRIDRIEPSKNIVRGFKAFDEMLDLHPEHRRQVKFLAFLVPSRLDVEEYRTYLDELMGIAGQVNAKHGDSEWEPIRILVGESYTRAVAALQLYNVLLVNSIADGMNLVAKEGPIVNRCNGVLVLSERTGAHQQLQSGALVISPLDVYGTAEALHQALTMPEEERQQRSERLRHLIEQEDIVDWLRQQLKAILTLEL